jgi:hypothetical protein
MNSFQNILEWIFAGGQLPSQHQYKATKKIHGQIKNRKQIREKLKDFK